MELSGNLIEATVTVGNAYGRRYTGLHGDGALSGNSHNVTNWPPGPNGYGEGYRGGSCADDVFITVSDRFYATDFGTLRPARYGFRAVRSLPVSVAQ